MSTCHHISPRPDTAPSPRCRDRWVPATSNLPFCPGMEHWLWDLAKHQLQATAPSSIWWQRHWPCHPRIGKPALATFFTCDSSPQNSSQIHESQPQSQYTFFALLWILLTTWRSQEGVRLHPRPPYAISLSAFPKFSWLLPIQTLRIPRFSAFVFTLSSVH